MSDETTEGTAARPVLRTLADKVNWLIDQTHPAGRGPCTNAEVAACEHDHGGAVPPRPDRKILSADSHVASLDIDVAYALSKLSTTEYRVDLDGAITILTVYEYNSGFKFGYPGIIRDKRGIPVPKEARQAIRSNDGSPHGPRVCQSRCDGE